MSVYLKILFSILPVLLFSLVGALGTTYYFCRGALRDLAVHWLEIRLEEAYQQAVIQEKMLEQFNLEEIVASARKAQMDAGKMIASVKVGGNGYAFAVNRRGMIAAHPDPAKIQKPMADSRWFEALHGAERGRVTFVEKGRRYFAVFKHFSPWNWYILVATPEKELLGALTRTHPYVVTFVFSGGIGVAMVLILICRRLTAPLLEITRAAERIGEGDLEVRIAVKRKDELGKLVAVFNQMADRLSESMAALKRSEKHFRRLIENASDIILLLDKKGIMIYATPSLERVMGYPPEQLIGRSIFDYVHPEDLDAVRGRFAALVQRPGITMGGAYRFRRRDGSWRYMEGVSNNMLEDPAVSGIIVNARDVTEKKHMEALREAKRAAESASRAKSEFLANMSHEIRTPLNAVVGLINLMQKTDLTPKQRDYLATMHRSAGVLLAIINDVLDYAKIEAGEMILEEKVFEPGAVVDHVVGLFSEQVSEKGLELMTFISPQVPEAVRGDPTRLEQVLMNLVSNAVKFTAAGEIVIRVLLESRDSDAVRLRFSVKDTGIGIAEEKRSQLFYPFTQGDASFTRKYGGTGLGLTISKRIVTAMNGDIRVESREGVGSDFIFTVNLKPVPGTGLWFTERRGPWTGKRALVLHPNATFQEMMRHLMRSFQIDTVSVASLREAVGLFDAPGGRADAVDMAFVNATLADAPGIEAAKKIRAQGVDCEIKTILMVPYGSQHGIESKAAGAVDAHLEKPVRMGAFQEVLKHLFRRPQGAPEIPEPGKMQGVHPLGRLRLLLVEDNPINQEVQREILLMSGMAVDVVQNGKQAVSAVRKSAYDLVLMDIQMPVMDGIEATRAIRTDAKFRDLPIVAMTAHVFSGERKRCMAAGMNDYLAKPVDPELLLKVIAKWTKRSRADVTRGVSNRDVRHPETPSPVVDLSEALSRISGRRVLLDKMMHMFADSYKNAAERIRQMVAARHRQEAAEFCHSMKGAAGSISAKRVYDAAADLEKALAEGGFGPVAELIERLDAELQQAIRFIQDHEAAGHSSEKNRAL